MPSTKSLSEKTNEVLKVLERSGMLPYPAWVKGNRIQYNIKDPFSPLMHGYLLVIVDDEGIRFHMSDPGSSEIFMTPSFNIEPYEVPEMLFTYVFKHLWL